MNEIHWGGVAAVAAMYAAFLAVGWYGVRKVRSSSTDDLLVAGRSMPVWIAVLTMTATWVDGGYLLGTAEYTYKHGLIYGGQGGICFGLSLIVGGLLFAARMRKMNFSTMIDAFDVRYGPRWAAVLALPAMLGEILWSGALLVAIGATFAQLLHVSMSSAILWSAVVVIAYTVVGGMWSVAYTDLFQLWLIPIGMLAAIPFAMDRAGGLHQCLQVYWEGHPDTTRWLPPLTASAGSWTASSIVAWWDMTIMLILGGIPWNCYFQRVLSCQTPAKASQHSILAGLLTGILTVPPMLLGMAALTIFGADGIEPASTTLPRLLNDAVPYPVMLLGLAAIVGAVTSSFSASILSAGAMFSWNIYRPLLAPDASAQTVTRFARGSIVCLGVAAIVLALRVRSVAALWLFTGDLVFVLLFPQLVVALYDRHTHWLGSMTGFVLSLLLRLGGGMSIETDNGLLGFAAWIRYPELFARWLPGAPADWYDTVGATTFPVRTLAMLAGLLVIPIVSRVVCPTAARIK